MHRDVEVAVIDVARGLGNGFTLPAGPLREPQHRLDEVDMIVRNGGDSEMPVSHKSENNSCVQLMPVGLRKLGSDRLISLDEWSDSMSVHAVAGIGHPERFAATLMEMGFMTELHAKNDHQALSIGDVQFNDKRPVIITEKDAIKYKDLVPDNLWVLEVRMPLSDEFVNKLLSCAGLPVTNL